MRNYYLAVEMRSSISSIYPVSSISSNDSRVCSQFELNPACYTTLYIKITIALELNKEFANSSSVINMRKALVELSRGHALLGQSLLSQKL